MPDAPEEDHSSLAPLRIPTFRRIWAGLLAFNIGHLFQVVASAWLILEMTGSPLWVSVMVGAPTLPLLVLSLPAGAAADLFDKRAILIVSCLVLAGASGAMSVMASMDALTPTRLVALGLTIGIGISFFNPAWQATVPSLVPTSLVPGAVSLNSASGGVATAVGPAIGGILIVSVGPTWTFAAASVGYCGLLAAMLTTPKAELNPDKGSLVVAIATGIRYLRFSRDYLWLLLLGSLFGFTSASLRAMLPNITSDILDGDSALYGLLLGLFGCGAMVGGLTRARVDARLGQQMIPLCIFSFGLTGVVLALSRTIALSIVSVTLAGALWTWILSTLISTYQMLTPDWVRGRTMGAFVLSVFGFVPLGSIAAGAVGESMGADRAVLIFSAAVVAVGFLAFRMPLPVLEQIQPPVVPLADEPVVRDTEPGGESVMLTTTWTVDDESYDRFVELLADLRRIRLRTGAYRWTVYRNVDDPRRISEIYLLHSWEQYQQLNRRVDVEAMKTIRSVDGLAQSQTVIRRQLVEFEIDRTGRRPSSNDLPAPETAP